MQHARQDMQDGARLKDLTDVVAMQNEGVWSLANLKGTAEFICAYSA